MTTETPKPVHPAVTPTGKTPPNTTNAANAAKVAPTVTPTTHTTPTHAEPEQFATTTVKAKVSPNVIQPSPTPETLVAEPKQPNHPQHETQDDRAHKDARARGYSIGPNEPPAHIKVKNVHTIALNLEAGIIQPGQTGLATDAEVSNLLGLYLEKF